MRKRLRFILLTPLLLATLLIGADAPKAEISNSAIRVMLYLPNAESGFYRGTRFDWSGMINSVVHNRHEYYGQWFQRVAPTVHDFAYEGSDIVASPCTAAVGPAEEFVTESGEPLGYQEATVGRTFVKIGVGALRKPDEAKYDHYRTYEIVNPGKWTVKTSPKAVDFTQELRDPSSGYAYSYRKTVRLVGDKSELVIEHSLRNIGTKPIETNVYDHNFLRIDQQPPGPDYTITVPFEVKSNHPPEKELVEIRGNRIVYLRTLKDQERVSTPIQGFGDTSKDYDVRIENTKAGAGMRITADQPLHSEFLWSIRAVLAVEPYIKASISPGKEFTWKMTYSYYSLGSANQSSRNQ
jgi:hypothetical protein